MKIKLKSGNNFILEYILAFFSMAIFSVSNIYVLNILFFFVFAICIVRSEGKLRITDRKMFYLLVFYICWTIIDAICVSVIEGYPISIRNVVQLVFEVQYLIWVFDWKIDFDGFLDKLVKVAFIYSIVLLSAFFLTGTFRHINQIFGIYREWGEGIFPGNTTSSAIPFIFALFWSLYYKKRYWYSILITIGGLLFPSRVSLLAMLIVWGFFLYYKLKKAEKLLFGVAIIAIIIIGIAYLPILNIMFPDLIYRLTLSWDRVDIFKAVFFYIKHNWLVGHGGRTLNQLYEIIPYKSKLGVAWPHAHNFVLELVVRYGVIGMLLFMFAVVSAFKKIENKKIRFIFMLFLIMALFQTYMREFDYVFFLGIMIQYDRKKIEKMGVL